MKLFIQIVTNATVGRMSRRRYPPDVVFAIRRAALCSSHAADNAMKPLIRPTWVLTAQTLPVYA